MGRAGKHRSRNKCRLSLRERASFRGAKGDYVTVILERCEADGFRRQPNFVASLVESFVAKARSKLASSFEDPEMLAGRQEMGKP
jgi:hypothetical protein